MRAARRAVWLVCALVSSGLARPAFAQQAPAAEGPEGEAPPAGLAHEAIATAPRGQPIAVIVGVQSELAFDKLILAYRPEDARTFHGREMKPVSAGTYRADIPAEATEGSTVSYYVEARDKDGAPVAGRASAQSPLVIQLVGATAASAKDDEEDDVLAGRHFFVGLLAGTGAGWATGNGDTNADTLYRPATLAPAWLGQLAPEVGYWVSPTLMLSAQGRFQAITGTTDVYADGRVYHTANYAAAGFLKATWVASGPGRAHPFFALAAGFGQVRHVVRFDALTTCGASGREGCVDTIAAGPVAVGPGAGFFVDVGRHFVGVFEIDSQLMLPAYSVNVDGNLGVAVRF